MKKLAIFMIEIYQKYISPYKGFSCAYRVATGEVSCSGYGKQVISRYGVMKGYSLLKRRFDYCKYCSDKLNKEKPAVKKIDYSMHPKLKHQQGYCDVDCSGCDVPDLGGCDLPDCGSCHHHFSADDACDVVECFSNCGNGTSSSSGSSMNSQKMGVKLDKKIEKKNKTGVSLEKNNENKEEEKDN